MYTYGARRSAGLCHSTSSTLAVAVQKARSLTHHATAALGIGPAALAYLRVVLLAMKVRRKPSGDGGEYSVAKALSRSGPH
jgi:hypothetical protein